MSHPAGDHLGVGRAPVWYGVECEGRLTGAMTAFLDAKPRGEELGELIERLSAIGDVKHLFVTENMREWSFVSALLTYVPPSTPVTVACVPAEVADVSALPFADRITLMVRIDMGASWLRLLKPDDQVCVGEPYYVHTWRKDAAVVSSPDDYLGDTRR